MRAQYKRSFVASVLVALLLTLVACFALPSQAFASGNRIYSLDTRVTINADMSARIDQLWRVRNVSGTEWFVPMNNLAEGSKIEDLRVVMSDKQFSTANEWDVDASFAEKSYRAGLHETSDGVEICFGKSVRGEATYKVSYTITNVLRQSRDRVPFLYFRFVNAKMDPAPSKASIAVDYAGLGQRATAKIWGFGFEGDLKPGQQSYVAQSFDFSRSHHVTLLMKFANVNNNDRLLGDSRKFTTIKKTALDGSDYDDIDKDDSANVLFGCIFAAVIGFISFIVVQVIKENRDKPSNIKTIKIDKNYYYRDVPLNGAIDAIYYLGDCKNLVSKTDRGFISAFFLKWIKEGAIYPQVADERKLFRSHQSQVLVMDHQPQLQSSLESVVWQMLVEAADDNTLSSKELRRYARKHEEELSEGFAQALLQTKQHCFTQNLFVYNNNQQKRYSLTQTGSEAIRNIAGLKQYLQDFTLINERTAQEVSLWDDYLICAAIFGIADEVAQEFKQLIPDYVFASERYANNSTYASFDDAYDLLWCLYFVNSFQQSLNSGLTSAQEARSSGSGGMSSFGGGMSGFSGGGFGGGSR